MPGSKDGAGRLRQALDSAKLDEPLERGRNLGKSRTGAGEPPTVNTLRRIARRWMRGQIARDLSNQGADATR